MADLLLENYGNAIGSIKVHRVQSTHKVLLGSIARYGAEPWFTVYDPLYTWAGTTETLDEALNCLLEKRNIALAERCEP